MKKNWVLIVFVLLFFAGIILGPVYLVDRMISDVQEFFEESAESREAKKTEAERMSVMALKNTYADIKSVEFVEDSHYNIKTGTYYMSIIMTNNNNESVNTSYSFSKRYKKIRYIGNQNDKVQVHGVTTNKVHVIYSNKEEGEVSGIGGKEYRVKSAEQKETDKIEAERMSVVALKNTYADIKSVEFEESVYNTVSGHYSMLVTITSINGDDIQFNYSFSPNHPTEIAEWRVNDKEKEQIKGRTNNKVEVIYTNGDEDEV